jgi:DNA-binding beta-propeller fold protein YncE
MACGVGSIITVGGAGANSSASLGGSGLHAGARTCEVATPAASPAAHANPGPSAVAFGTGTLDGDGGWGSCYGIAVNSLNGEVYVADYCGDRVAVFSSTAAEPPTFLRSIGSGALVLAGLGSGQSRQLRGPRGLAVHPATGVLWVADYGNDQLQALDPASGNGVGTAAIISLPHDIAFSPDGATLFVASQRSVVVMDVTTGTVRGRLGGEKELAAPCGVCVDHSGRVAIADQDAGRLSMWDPLSGRQVGEIVKPGMQWLGVAASASASDGTLYAIAAARYGVTVVDTRAWAVLRRITAAADGTTLGQPQALAVNGNSLLLAREGGRGLVLPLPSL